ncbi:tRNA (adenosine(37)-N6)-threonylcarbamoyltransferase complex dimerization subunit type 1 TsaB [Rhizobium oryzicola]|uniref:tRNA (Adenosine(37)-N6)-threonylcarbamoyltransferase complex dimerization subunit type 1 TsaB n=1 Tax=Rhizobium oryzicola TaxID=1232668 RepID=A0ABT8SRY5_9HYPH|nr:tRNA (adenosine(37)-N6)-threonylcarbamoyltransferase complex dimerization subunit type 1 TsaB [Rhizobium oryzicola]MDO1580819.1 tRNA (adenosine(37)-N6)-threonylcarbamoyltransferase complex dimerization subunit type 1 TsaB [Rhizobium oryzicola]
MKVLAIDTAGVDCSAAVFCTEQGRILSEITERIGKGHAERLMAMIDEVLAAASLPLQSIARIGVTIGPGSFTGIRVGVATARGLALSLPAQAVGVVTLNAMARSHLDCDVSRPVIAAMDAKRSEIYAQAFGSDGKPLTEPQIVTLEALKALADQYQAEIIGTAAPLLRGEPAATEPDRFDIATVARIAAEADDKALAPKPLYLRGPDAKPQDGFALARA